MKLSIIVVSWNTELLLEQCLNSVDREVIGELSFQVETIVVDNASADGSPEMVQERFPWVQLVVNGENQGFAKGNNQGIELSSGHYILLLNSDTIVHPGALRTLVEFMDQNTRAGAAGARLLNGDGTLQSSCHPMLTPNREFWHLMFLDNIWSRSKYPLHSWDDSTPQRVEVIKGACLLLRRDALDEVGLLDERYHMYTEEVDLCYRLDGAGWQLWHVPTAVVTHFGGASSSQKQEEMYLELYRSKIQFYRKFGGAARARRFKLMLAAAYLPRTLFRPRNKNYQQLLINLRTL